MAPHAKFTALFVMATLASLLAIASAATAFKPKNVVLFLNDQQNNLDWFPRSFFEKANDNVPLQAALNANGMRFKRAFTNGNMCSSSRMSIVTGLYNSQHQGVLTLTSPNVQSPYEVQLSDLLPTFGTMLKDAGYEVVYFGKNHLSKGYFNASSGVYVHDYLGRYGFDNWNGEPPLGTRGIGGFGGQPTTSKLDVWATANATAWLTQRMADVAKGVPRRPFMLICSVWNPHDMPLAYPGVGADPFNVTRWNPKGFMVKNPNVDSSKWVPKWFASGYSWDTPSAANNFTPNNFAQVNPMNGKPYADPIEIPASYTEVYANISLVSGRPEYNNRTTIKPASEIWFRFMTQLGLGPINTVEQMQNYTNLYAQGVIYADWAQFKLYELMKNYSGLLEDTIIIKTSDHGDAMMSHGAQRQKPFMPYREALGVNLVWSNPVLFPKGKESDALVSHVDFIPTLMDMLNVDVKKYKLPGKSYLKVLTGEVKSVQDFVLFMFNDRWATFDMANPPTVNLLANTTNIPIMNISAGFMPPPAEIYVMETSNYTVAINYDTSLFPAEEETSCYDNTPTGGDWDAKYGVPLQLINLSPWAQGIRAGLHIPLVGTPAQAKHCADLLKQLRRQVKLVLKPIKKFPLQPVPHPVSPPPPIGQYNGPTGASSKRLFVDHGMCKEMCVELLFWSHTGQNYQVTLKARGQDGLPFEQALPNLQMTQGDDTGPYRFVNFASVVPGCNGPVYLIAGVPNGTHIDDIAVRTVYTEEQALSKYYINPKVPTSTGYVGPAWDPEAYGLNASLYPMPSGCVTNCPWNITTQGFNQLNPYFLAQVIHSFGAMH